jgi:hypothetical protein
MLTLRSHKEALAAGSQPVVGLLCTPCVSVGSDWSLAARRGYALVGTSDQPAITFPMNPEVGR